MGNLKKIFLFVAGVALAAFAQSEPMDVKDVAFSKAYIGIEGGEIYPFGDLIDAVYNTYYGGFNFRYSYWKNVDGVVMFHYAYFEPRPKAVPYDGVHQASGKLGLDWRFPLIRPVVVGGGFACNWTRADLDDGVVMFHYAYFEPRPKAVPYDGVHQASGKLGLDWNFPIEIWTLPKRSDMLYAGIYVERKLW